MKKALCWGLLLSLIMTCGLQAGVTFSGVDGAVTWVWVEGENYTSISNGSLIVAGLGRVSGYNASFPANEVQVESGYITWNIDLPMNISSAKMYAHCASYYVDGDYRKFFLYIGDINGDLVGSIYNGEGNEGFKDGVYWSENGGDIGSLSQGSMQLTAQQYVYNIMYFDGFFLTDGTVDIANNPPTTAGNSSGTYWMQHPTFTSLPTLTGPVTFSVSDAPSGARYFVNGKEFTGGSITLQVSGTYYLEVRSSDGIQSLMGVAFVLDGIAPTGPTFSGVDGAITWVWIEGENYTTISNGNWLAAGLGSVSGYNASLPSNEIQVGSGYATWNIDLPMDMSNAKMYAHCASYYVDGDWRGFYLLDGGADGTLIGSIYSGGGSEGSKDAVYWSENGGNLGSMLQGSMQLTVKQNVYNIMYLDGFFLTDGTVDFTGNPPTTAGNSSGTCWMQHPTFTSLPTLTGPVTFSVSNPPDDARYFVNGMEVRGPSITLQASGTYYIDVRASDGVQALMGAAFVLDGVDLPTFSGIDGAVTWVWVEAEDYTNISGGSKATAGRGSVSGYNPSLPSNEVSVDSGYVTWDVILPMNMTHTNMYAHCSSYYVDGEWRYFNILNGGSDGIVLGSIYSGEGAEGWKDAIYWSKNGLDMGALSHGSLQLTVKQNVYNVMVFDGFFLTDGTADVTDDVPSTAETANGNQLMQCPVFTSLPTLQGPVTLNMNNMAAGSRYYVNGEEITSASITLNKSGTYYVEVRKSNGVQTSMGAAFILSGLEPAATPVFSPAGPEISGPTDVTITCTTSGASIYYTTDGTTPSATNGILYSRSVAVKDRDILRAVAVISGYADSDVNTMTYRSPTIPIMAWYSIPSGEASAEQFKTLRNCGFTHSMRVYTSKGQIERALDNAWKSGIKLVAPAIGSLSYKDHPALEAYYIQDEPSYSDFSSLAERVQAVQALDGDHWCYINLHGIYATTLVYGGTYEYYVDRYLNTVPTDVLSFDHYPVTTSGIRANFYQNLEIISAKAQAKGIPFWAFALSTPHSCYPTPTLTHLRFQMFSNLAYGAQGLQYFTYWQSTDTSEYDFHDAPIDAAENPTSTYYVVQTMNEEIKGLSPVFLGARADRVRHTGSSIPSGTIAYTPVAPVQSLTTSGSSGAVVSELTNGDNHYIVIVNRDINNTMTLNLTVDTSKSFSRVAKDGSVTALTGGTMSFTVDPADIVVLKWGNAVTTIPGDANRDGSVDVGDLGILAANYGGSGKSWSQGDFNGDGLVDVGDLGILAAHYGTNASSADWTADYAKVFGTTAEDNSDDAEATGSSICSGLGLPLIAGLLLMGLMWVKLEE